jgi:hypothetical protein
VPLSTLVSSLSFSMKGIRWPTAFFMTRADFITCEKSRVRHVYQFMASDGYLYNVSTNEEHMSWPWHSRQWAGRGTSSLWEKLMNEARQKSTRETNELLLACFPLPRSPSIRSVNSVHLPGSKFLHHEFIPIILISILCITTHLKLSLMQEEALLVIHMPQEP